MKRIDHIDWVDIENKYVTGTMSYRSLASAEGISYSAVKDHGVANNWYQKRSDYQNDCTAKAAQKTADKISDNLSKLADINIKTALELARKLNYYIKNVTLLKTSELLQAAQAWKILNEAVQKQEPAENTANCGIIILPARERIDPPKDDPDMEQHNY